MGTGRVMDEKQQDEIREARPDGEERLYTGEPLEVEDDGLDVPAQQNVGREAERGGGEWPHPETPPQPPAPGSVDETRGVDDGDSE